MPSPCFFLSSILFAASLLLAQPSVQAAIQPVAPQWNASEILSWTPGSDPADPYNRSTVPLASRFRPPTASEDSALNAVLNVNSHAHVAEARVEPLVAWNFIPVPASQGWPTTQLYAPTVWQYWDHLVVWGASTNDRGSILTPPAHIVDAGHRNGVPVLGKIMWGWNGSADDAALQDIRNLLIKSGSTFPVADKLIQVAQYYGFDGYFINQENYQTSATDAANMRDFVIYFRSHAPSNVQLIWYDSMAEDGSRSYQNAFTTSDDWYMKYNSSLGAQNMFLNFWWYYNSANLSNSRTLALSEGVDPYSLYAGIWTEHNRTLGKTPDPNGNDNLDIKWDYLFPEGQPHNTSLGLFDAECPFYKGNQVPSTVLTSEITYWCGQNNDPSNTVISGTAMPNWPGIAHYIPANSSITTVPFVTNFNTGQGTFFKVNGTSLTTTPWTNLSTQDLLPTWKWIVKSTGTKLTPTLDFTDAYYGGGMLKVTGNTLTAGSPNEIKLYQMSLPVSSDTKLRVVYKGGASTATMEVGIALQDNPSGMIYLNPVTTSSSWTQSPEISLGAYAGKRIALLTLRFSASSTTQNYTMNVGRISIYNGAIGTPAAPSNVSIEATGPNPDNAYAAQARVKWTASSSPVQYYNVYYRSGSSTKWIGATPNTYYFAPDIRKIGSETDGTIEVEAVGPDFGVQSVRPSTPFSGLSIDPDLSYQLTGPSLATIGTAGAFGGGTVNTKEKVFDGPITTYFDAPITDGAWAGQDLGSPKVITYVQYSPRNSSDIGPPRLVGGKFQATNDSSLATWVTLYTVGAVPARNSITTVPVNDSTPYRYVRYLSPNGGSGNISEARFFGATAVSPSFSLAGGTYQGSQTVTLATTTPGSTIRYTTDGSTPTASSLLYTGPITVSSSSTIKAIVFKDGYKDSAVITATYTIAPAATPVCSPAEGTYTTPQTVTISTTTSGASIYYTTDGSAPTTGSTLYTGAFSVGSTTTVKAIAIKSGFQNSSVASTTYTIVAAPPVFSPVGGSYPDVQSVTLSTTTSGASIYYTTDGSDPTAASTLYTGAFSVDSTTTVKAIAIKSGLQDSTVASAAYTISAATPVFSPVGGSYSAIQSITLSTGTPGAVIRYTTDGSDPTASSTLYTDAFELDSTATVKAVAFKDGNADSPVASATYAITLPVADAPVFSPVAGDYSAVQSITISTTTPGAEIRYTTDGSDPTASSVLYTGAFNLEFSATLKAIALEHGYQNSPVTSATYNITFPTADAPVFLPAAGTYTGAQSVTLSTTTDGAAIYYTTDGSDPTASSTPYTGAFSVDSTTTVKAIALKSGYQDSALTTADYIINPAATPSPTPVPVPAPPTLIGKTNIRTDDSQIVLKGKVSAPGTYVEYRVGKKGKYSKAKGGTKWKVTAKLKMGKNTIFFHSVNPASGGKSSDRKVIVTRT